MNTKLVMFSALALIAASTQLVHAAPADKTDQVVASFDRMLHHAPATTAIRMPVASKAEADPLVASVNAVLWEQPSYHLATKYAALSVKSKKE